MEGPTGSDARGLTAVVVVLAVLVGVAGTVWLLLTRPWLVLVWFGLSASVAVVAIVAGRLRGSRGRRHSRITEPMWAIAAVSEIALLAIVGYRALTDQAGVGDAVLAVVALNGLVLGLTSSVRTSATVRRDE